MSKGLTREDWRKINKASDIADPEGWRAAVDAVVRARMAKAWHQGFDKGFAAGVDDATLDDPPSRASRRNSNPYGAGE